MKDEKLFFIPGPKSVGEYSSEMSETAASSTNVSFPTNKQDQEARCQDVTDQHL